MMDSIYWFLHERKFEESLEKLKNTTSEQLVSLVINQKYNSFLSKYADYFEGENPILPTTPVGIGKRIPYIGWGWRECDFYNRTIPIGDCNEFIGFMYRNKWDYDERDLTIEEFNQVMGIIDSAIFESQQGGDLKDIRFATRAELEKLWPLFQTFKI